MGMDAGAEAREGKQGPGPPLQDLPPAKLASCKTFKFFYYY